MSYISIHAPREGSDSDIALDEICVSNFNPRSPRGERRQSPYDGANSALFQSTLPARGATVTSALVSTVTPVFQSTLPARGATKADVAKYKADAISIHAPREGSDVPSRFKKRGSRNISIHAPREGSDGRPRNGRLLLGISIHAPREGSDPHKDNPWR